MQPHPTKPNTDVVPVRRSTTPTASVAYGDTVSSGEDEAPVFEKPAGQVDTVPGHACPHCGAPMIDHGVSEGPKANAWHCNACGGCWVHRGSAWFLREGHPAPAGWGAATG